MNKKVQIKTKMHKIEKISTLFILLCIISYSNRAQAEILKSEPVPITIEQIIKQKKITLNIKNKPLKSILFEIQKQSGIGILFKNITEIDALNDMSIEVKDASIEAILTQLLAKTNLTYTIVDNTVNIVVKKPAQTTKQTTDDAKLTVTGRVIDAQTKKPIVGATVIIPETAIGAITDSNGDYSITKIAVGTSVEASVVGYVSMIKTVNGTTLNFNMKEDIMAVDDVIVSGYFAKTKQSYTGSEVQVKGNELRKVGSLNLLQAISVFDPSVRTITNNERGSDPNRVPEITIRGENGFDLRSSADDSKTNPNAPLYILDGLEVSATRVYDLDMNRIESFTILKDASATSLYGSRGANGVIVIATLRPKEGEVQVSVNANYNISIPDLRDYNLMDAREKLNYEVLAGEYKSSWGRPSTQLQYDMLYNNRLKEIERGVSTYWLSQPLRTSVNQRYNAYIEGGDGSFRYGIDLKYDTDKGVMKKSGREKIGASVNFNYNFAKKLYIINDLTVNDVKGENSPYGSLADYSSLNPYERIYDRFTGELIKKFAYEDLPLGNPLYNATLPNKNYNKYTEISDNLSLDWRINDHFRVNGRLGITKKLTKDEIYRSPFSTEFDAEKEIKKKGSYTTSNGNRLDFDGNFTASYNNTFKNDVTLSVGVGTNLTTLNTIADGYTATGFLNDNMNFVQYAQQFKENSTPTGSFDKSRMIGFFGNLNVGYKNRYFIDGSFRTDGSSRFGRNSRFAPFWSIGAAWNLDKEEWWKGEGFMKLRASVGSTGVVNFSADQAITKYQYKAENEYNGVYGATLMGYGNPGLKWQTTLQYNIGLDMSVWKNIIVLNIDAYIKKTQNLLLPIDVAPSTGFISYTENMGEMENKGVDFRLRFNLLNSKTEDLNWSVTLAGFHNTNIIKKLSNALEAMNAEAMKLENSQGPRPLRTYQAGRSQSALMVVRSMGIDPRTGNEIYVKLNGDLTYDYDAKDKIVVGDTYAKFQGNLQSNLNYKGFNLFFALNYEFGAKEYNATVAQKVEGSNPKTNSDRRVLYNRWKKPGDIAMYRRIDDQTKTNQSTRLVQTKNVVNLQSLSLSYQVPDKYLDDIFIERCKITFTTSDLFRISTIKAERGTAYPFAQTFSVGLNLTF